MNNNLASGVGFNKLSNMRTDYDVIVVGAGGSGLAAACSAAQSGGRVLVLEKEPRPGGTTGIAVGSFTSSCTRLQRQAQVDDSPQDHAEDAGKFAPPDIERRNNTTLRAFFLSETAETMHWLEGMGLSFVGPRPEPPNRQPRMHNVVPGAKAYIATLQMVAQRAGVTLLCSADVESLLQDASRVTGVRVRVANQTRKFIATRGVILAGGDYANNPDLIAKHKGERFREIEGINPHATGRGHVLAEAAGAKMVNMEVTYGPELRFLPSGKKPFQQWLPASAAAAKVMAAMTRWMPPAVMHAMIKRLLVTWQHPENALFDDGAILFNTSGQRFTRETAWPDREIAVARQPGKIAYILLDHRLIEKYSAWPHFISTAPDIAYAYVSDYQRLRPDVTRVGRDLRRLAVGCGFDADAVVAAAAPMQQGGDWALLGPVKAYFTTTEGGALVNEQLQVLDENQAVIPGLYAVGQNGLGGMILWSHGLHIAWAMTSGRLAGENVMRNEF